MNFRSYHLEIEQQPVGTAEFGTMYLSRVPITPPIVARLIVRDLSGNSIVPYVITSLTYILIDELRRGALFRESELPFLVAHLSLYSDDGAMSLDTGSFIGRGLSDYPPMLYGHLVSTVEQFEDLQGNMGLFFLFPDVSVRNCGRYQLGVSLIRITRFESDSESTGHFSLFTQPQHEWSACGIRYTSGPSPHEAV